MCHRNNTEMFGHFPEKSFCQISAVELLVSDFSGSIRPADSMNEMWNCIATRTPGSSGLRLSSKIKIFFAVLFACLITLMTALHAVRTAFDREILHPCREHDARRIRRVAIELGKDFAQHGSWDFLRDSPARWESALNKVNDDNEDRSDVATAPCRLDNASVDAARQSMSAALFDARHYLIVSTGPDSEPDSPLVRITNQGRVVGWLTAHGIGSLTDTIDATFKACQTRLTWEISLLCVVLSTLISTYTFRLAALPPTG